MTLLKVSVAAEPASDQPLILIVEDEFLVRLVAADALRDVGYRVLEADNADEAVAILTAGVPVDLVFSDVRMPGSLDGLGLLALTQSGFPEVPVVICSGHFDPTQALACGADGFVAKPYRVDKMVAEITETLERKTTAR